ncbi:hypothetical protein FC99_GL000865 [Levilactobacillus koreensis JCM 16448]|uniref:Uncharacterized protein n=1 Tax=Levilactobacillus koreensis TaxID=637971 RepID=A0AAC8UWW1_9LACO|nr:MULTISPECIES: hypothetical protein [Levilactobacillus]AKP64600.1 hypothetical protein ABN16_06070 [Levilactobacillus koreensis]KRK92162.1 hypothetical protein FC99_GL000865 [Levilactobacillus koreensis JCM 16448]
MTENLVLAPPEALELAKHLDEWAKWRQTTDRTTADMDWDRFIENSREKAEWQAGLATEIEHWENLHAIQMALQDNLVGMTAGGHTRQ